MQLNMSNLVTESFSGPIERTPNMIEVGKISSLALDPSQREGGLSSLIMQGSFPLSKDSSGVPRITRMI